MKKSGLLRRVVILIAFAIAFDQFVLSGSQYIAEAEPREFLKLFLWGATAFGIVTVLAQHLRGEPPHDKEDP